MRHIFLNDLDLIRFDIRRLDCEEVQRIVPSDFFLVKIVDTP